jgi:5-methylcytosine-specific restriction endonuclease McrA
VVRENSDARARGRPRGRRPGVTRHVKLPRDVYEGLKLMAAAEEQSIESIVIRGATRMAFPHTELHQPTPPIEIATDAGGTRRIFRPGQHNGYLRHEYPNGPPPLRLRRMQFANERRARLQGVLWERVDFRDVFAKCEGICGICLKPVGFDEFTVDHIVALSLGGCHLYENLQIAHGKCNTQKGVRLPRGRPKEFDSILSVRLPAELHEAVVVEALKRRVDVSDVVRECLASKFVFQK